MLGFLFYSLPWFENFDCFPESNLFQYKKNFFQVHYLSKNYSPFCLCYLTKFYE